MHRGRVLCKTTSVTWRFIQPFLERFSRGPFCGPSRGTKFGLHNTHTNSDMTILHGRYLKKKMTGTIVPCSCTSRERYVVRTGEVPDARVRLCSDSVTSTTSEVHRAENRCRAGHLIHRVQVAGATSISPSDHQASCILHGHSHNPLRGACTVLFH
jgi:hypothetical protein